jgi:hypothetical protein
MIITSKEINLTQLDKELGSQGLCNDFNDSKKKVICVSDDSTVTQEELEAAVAAHVAGPTEEEIVLLNREQGLAKLKELGFTDEQIKALIG